MKTSKELLEQRAAIREQMRDIVRNAEKESRAVLSAEENERFGQFDAEYNSITEQLETARKIEEMKAEEAETRAKADENFKAQRSLSPEEQKAKEKEIFWKTMKLGEGRLTPEEREFMAKRQSFQSPTRGTSTQITVTDSLGGYLVPMDFSNELEKRMKYYGGMLNACRILRTAAGERIEWPTIDDTGTTGSQTSESSPSIAVSDLTVGQKLLDAYTYDSGIIKTSVQLLQDSYFDLEAEVSGFFAERLGRKLNADLTTANGSDKPNGIITAVTAAGTLTTAADDATISRGDLVDLIHSVDLAYRANGAFMMNDSTVKAIRKLSFGSADDRPLWVQSMRDGQPDTIEGFRYFVNNDMAAIGGGNKSVLFGDFNKYVIRIVQDMVMVPLRELYMASLQVGYISYMRADGELIQPNAVYALRHPNT